MHRILLVGASGQLGAVILGILLSHEVVVRIVLRDKNRCPRLPEHHQRRLEISIGDLNDPDSLIRAAEGTTQVICTASSIVPAKGDVFGVNELSHYANLLEACHQCGVQHLVYISAFTSPQDNQIPEFRVKRQVEALIRESGVPYTIFRVAAFMDIYYAVMGSRLALDGVAQPTLLRGFWLTRLYARLTTGLLENHGIAVLPGKARHAFITVADVAAFMVRALDLPGARNRVIELAGPEALSWPEVAAVYARVLQRRVIAIPLPSVLLRLLTVMLRPFSPAAENILCLLELLGRYDHTPDMSALIKEFDLDMSTTDAYLKDKLH